MARRLVAHEVLAMDTQIVASGIRQQLCLEKLCHKSWRGLTGEQLTWLSLVVDLNSKLKERCALERMSGKILFCFGPLEWEKNCGHV